MESDYGASFGRVLVINENPLSSTSGPVGAGGDSVPRAATLALVPSWPFRCALHSASLCVVERYVEHHLVLALPAAAGVDDLRLG